LAGVILAAALALPAAHSAPPPSPAQAVAAGTLLVLNVRQETVSQGTGFAIDSRRTVVTNNHVIRQPGKLYVAAPGGHLIPARLLTADARLDLALLRATAPVPKLAPGDARDVHVGEAVAAAGYPRQLSRDRLFAHLRPVTTTGVIAGLKDRGREIDGRPLVLLRTTAAVQPGNSGGPLYRRKTGEVIGVMVSGLAINKRLTSVTFAIPINEVYGLQSRHTEIRR